LTEGGSRQLRAASICRQGALFDTAPVLTPS